MEDYDSLQELSSQLGAHTTNLTSTNIPRSLKLIRYIYGELCSTGFLSQRKEKITRSPSRTLKKSFDIPNQRLHGGNQTSGSTPATHTGNKMSHRSLSKRQTAKRAHQRRGDASPRKTLFPKRDVYLWGAVFSVSPQGLRAGGILTPQGMRSHTYNLMYGRHDGSCRRLGLAPTGRRIMQALYSQRSAS